MPNAEVKIAVLEHVCTKPDGGEVRYIGNVHGRRVRWSRGFHGTAEACTECGLDLPKTVGRAAAKGAAAEEPEAAPA